MKKIYPTLIICLFAFGLLINISCEKDIEGCTNPIAENFNPDANIENGMCILPRDKFLGVFEASLRCEAPLRNSEEFDIIIEESVTDENRVEITFVETEIEIPVLTALVSGNEITIDSTTQSVAIDPSRPGFKSDFTFFGSAIISDDENRINGTLSLLVDILDSVLSCDIEAERK